MGLDCSVLTCPGVVNLLPHYAFVVGWSLERLLSRLGAIVSEVVCLDDIGMGILYLPLLSQRFSTSLPTSTTFSYSGDEWRDGFSVKIISVMKWQT